MQGNGREETAMIDLVVHGDTVVTPQGVGAYDILFCDTDLPTFGLHSGGVGD